jgi:uroporphyrinogen-III decarboxylase
VPPDGKITKLSIADHVTTFLSRAQAEAFWVPYVRRVTGAFDGAVKVYHNEGRIGHLCGLLPAAGFDAWQVGPDALAAVRNVVGPRFALYGNVDPVELLVSGSPAAVARACRAAMVAGGRDGAFILSSGGGEPRTGIPVANFQAAYDACHTYGRYPFDD